ncbi:hypothetical protein FB45DRAFT_1006345 [Roridomyces roridus]|uniref:Uncharacterized protein n=1 Tax=Roridomyces roridus TaxID=1738132 RepID=A0AAD7BJ13_9AGAR|nr:hypothetical protein FB45DRAFT_1006345 [Roridomyces roridus]
MPPLQRQETRGSLRSWWSDSNPMLHISPTINIHALAKPLMRFMYHRQALGIMEQNRDAPLSEELLEIYSSYLSSMILEAIMCRAPRKNWFKHACGRELSQTPRQPTDLNCIRRFSMTFCTCWNQILARWNQATVICCAWSARSWKLFFSVASGLATNESNSAKKTIMLDITSILGVCRTSQAVAIALLESDNVETRQYTWLLIHYLDGFTQMALIQTIPTEKWGHILSKGSWSGQEQLTSVLIKIAGHRKGAAVIIAANILEPLDLHLDLKTPTDMDSICILLECLVQHGFAVRGILKTDLMKRFAHACCQCPDQYRFDCNGGHRELPVEEFTKNPDLAAAISAALDTEHLTKGLNFKAECTRTRLYDSVPVSRKAAVALATMSWSPNSATAVLVALGGMENLMESLLFPQTNLNCSCEYPCSPCYLFIRLTGKGNVAHFFQSPQGIERLESFVINPQAHEDASFKAAALLADIGQSSEAGAALVDMARVYKCIRERATTSSASYWLRISLEWFLQELPDGSSS